ncbi:MAG: hypothetical protein ACXVBE_12685, partial [Bdellovibrionota bacterium]
LALCSLPNAQANEGLANDAGKGCIIIGTALVAGAALGEAYHGKVLKRSEAAVLAGGGCIGGMSAGMMVNDAQAAEAPSDDQLNKDEPATENSEE